MPQLHHMPAIEVDKKILTDFGGEWVSNGKRLPRKPPYSGAELGRQFDQAVGKALASMLGGIPVQQPNANSLLPPDTDCVEVGDFRIIGGVRPQNFDVGYRPDGVRFAFDSKTLNDLDSVRKNYQNMINDIASEATTVHTRFPYAVVSFMVIIPNQCLREPQRSALVETLERLTGRRSINDPSHLAEAISLVVWIPENGTIDPDIPAPKSSLLRIENYSEQIEATYTNRYKGLPPHTG